MFSGKDQPAGDRAGVPKQRDVRDLLRLYGVADTRSSRGDARSCLRGTKPGLVGDFKDLDDDKLPEHIGRYIALEQGASNSRATKVTSSTGCCRPKPTRTR